MHRSHPLTTVCQMRVVIFGGTGFVGAHYARLLLEKYPEALVVLCDRVPLDESRFAPCLVQELNSPRLQYRKVDIRQHIPDDLERVISRLTQTKPEDRYASTNDLAHDLEYFIYKDGYGPTIQTLEAYLRKTFPFLYKPSLKTLSRRAEIQEETTRVLLPDATLIRD